MGGQEDKGYNPIDHEHQSEAPDGSQEGCMPTVSEQRGAWTFRSGWGEGKGRDQTTTMNQHCRLT